MIRSEPLPDFIKTALLLALMLSLISISGNGSCQLPFSGGPVYPEGYSWIDEWNRMKELPGIAPVFNSLRIVIPFRKVSNQERSGYIASLIDDDGIEKGSLLIDHGWQTIIRFQTNRDLVMTRSEISPAQARQIADAFTAAFIKDATLYTIDIRESKRLDGQGVYEFWYTYYYKKIGMISVDISVNAIGHITECSIFRNRINDLTLIPDPPNENELKQAVKKALRDKGYDGAAFTLLDRCYSEADGFYWRGYLAKKNNDGESSRADFTFNEKTRSCRIDRWMGWIDPSENPPNDDILPELIFDDSPTLSPDGSMVLWQTRGHWETRPSWLTSENTSIYIDQLKKTVPAIYRPLSEKQYLLNYDFPVISPDGLYLSFVISDRYLMTVDMETNQIAGVIDVAHCDSVVSGKLWSRPSWNHDMSSILLSLENKILICTKETGTLMSYTAAPVLLIVPGKCQDAQFIPSTDDRIITFYYSENSQAWHLAILTVEHNNVVKIRELNTRVDKPHSLRPSYDGKFVLYSDGGHCYLLEMANEHKQELLWLSAGKSLGNDLTVPEGFSFDVSKDMKTIVFTAIVNRKDEEGMVICKASIDGTEISRLSPSRTAILPLYLLNGKANTEKDYIPDFLLEDIGYIKPIEWRYLPPEIKPAVRRVTGGF